MLIQPRMAEKRFSFFTSVDQQKKRENLGRNLTKQKHHTENLGNRQQHAAERKKRVREDFHVN